MASPKVVQVATGLRFILKDGTKLETDHRGPWTAREQIAWEEHFKQAFTTVYRAQRLDGIQLAEDGDAPLLHFQVSWVLWFGWYRLRPKVANRFSTFIDEQLDDWEFMLEEITVDEEPDVEPDAPAVEDGSLDPTAAGSQPPADSTPEPSPAQ